MSLYKNKYRVESIRLKTWDYSKQWWYYVTINTKHHKEWFGEIRTYKVRLNKLGKQADCFWKEIKDHYNQVELDFYVVMPNHIHGIIIIDKDVETGHPAKRDKLPRLYNKEVFIPH